jgi:hypothetical protein
VPDFLWLAILLEDVFAQISLCFFFLHVIFHDHGVAVRIVVEMLHGLKKGRPVSARPRPVDSPKLAFFCFTFQPGFFLSFGFSRVALRVAADVNRGVTAARATARAGTLAAGFLFLLFPARFAAVRVVIRGAARLPGSFLSFLFLSIFTGPFLAFLAGTVLPVRPATDIFALGKIMICCRYSLVNADPNPGNNGSWC